jgi:hypothetical protein
VQDGANYQRIIYEHQRQSGSIGIILLRARQPLGAVRTDYDPASGYEFPIKAVVDASCRPAPHQETDTGATDTLQRGRTMRITLGGQPYDFLIGAGSYMYVNFARNQG